jgi:hypothetical protein
MATSASFSTHIHYMESLSWFHLSGSAIVDITCIKIVHRLSRVFIIFPSFCDDAFSHSRGARHGDVPLLSAEKDLSRVRDSSKNRLPAHH